MSSSKSSTASEGRDLEMYIKYAVLKFLQCVVHSRHTCDRLRTDSKILLGIVSADWFNLCLPDNPLVLEEIKNLFDGRTVDLNQPVCIEIYLMTPDGETMTIEYWWISKYAKGSPKDTFGKVGFYNNLTTLLKSLLLITRSTPGYAIARNQSHTSLKLYHRLMFGEPPAKCFENFKKHLVGRALSSVGTVEIHVAWKSRLLFTAKRTSELSHRRKVDNLHYATKQSKSSTPKTKEETDTEFLPAERKAAFCTADAGSGLTPIDDDVPFASLLKYANSPSITMKPRSLGDNEDGIDILHDDSSSSFEERNANGTSPKQMIKMPDDFVMVEPNYPFANQEELIKFYQEFQDAPSLIMFENDLQLEQSLTSILEQMAQFELNADVINDFVNSLERLDDT